MRQRFTYILVGLGNLLIGIAFITLLLHGLKWPYLWATFIGNAIGILCSSIIHRRYVYPMDQITFMIVGKSIAINLFSHMVAYILIHPWLYHAIIMWTPDWNLKLQLDVMIFWEASIFTILSSVLQKLIIFPPVQTEPLSFHEQMPKAHVSVPEVKITPLISERADTN